MAIGKLINEERSGFFPSEDENEPYGQTFLKKQDHVPQRPDAQSALKRWHDGSFRMSDVPTFPLGKFRSRFLVDISAIQFVREQRGYEGLGWSIIFQKSLVTRRPMNFVI
jgi:hypothetical protein